MKVQESVKPNGNNVKTMEAKKQPKKAEKVATPTKTSATPKPTAEKVQQILKPSGKTIVKRLQHAQILADKFEKMTDRYDDLTQFIAGKDAENSTMKFASESGYSFTLSNPATISRVLEMVETEFSQHLANSETELLNFQIQ